jgi:hypothetical protein
MTGDMGRPGRHRDQRLEYALKPDRAETTFDRTVADADRVLGQIGHLLGADPVVEILDELAYRHGCPPPSMMKPLSFSLHRANVPGMSTHSHRHRLDLLGLIRHLVFHAQCCTTKCRLFNPTGHRHIATHCRRHRSGSNSHTIGRVIREYQTCAHVSFPVARKL